MFKFCVVIEELKGMKKEVITATNKSIVFSEIVCDAFVDYAKINNIEKWSK